MVETMKHAAAQYFSIVGSELVELFLSVKRREAVDVHVGGAAKRKTRVIE